MKRQPNSRHCFLCGVDNPIGLKLAFFDTDDRRVVARFVPGEAHQGYPGVMHGGIASALLDETIGRTLESHGLWAMTVDLSVHFHRPVPLDQPLLVIGEVVRLRSRTMEGKGEIRLDDGTVAITAEARYYILPEDRVDGFKSELGYWQVVEEDGEQAAATAQAVRRIVSTSRDGSEAGSGEQE